MESCRIKFKFVYSSSHIFTIIHMHQTGSTYRFYTKIYVSYYSVTQTTNCVTDYFLLLFLQVCAEAETNSASIIHIGLQILDFSFLFSDLCYHVVDFSQEFFSSAFFGYILSEELCEDTLVHCLLAFNCYNLQLLRTTYFTNHCSDFFLKVS